MIYIFLVMYKKKLTNEMYDIDKPKHEYEDELNDKLHNKKILSSKIMEQFEEIQRLLGELKFEKKYKYLKFVCDLRPACIVSI